MYRLTWRIRFNLGNNKLKAVNFQRLKLKFRKDPLKRALITGITGQDGFHLTELLQTKGYKIFGSLNIQRKSRMLEFSNKFLDVELLEGEVRND